MERWPGGTDCISESNGHHPVRPSWPGTPWQLAGPKTWRQTSRVVTREGGRAQTPGHLVPRRATHPSGQRQGSLAHFLGPSPPHGDHQSPPQPLKYRRRSTTFRHTAGPSPGLAGHCGTVERGERRVMPGEVSPAASPEQCMPGCELRVEVMRHAGGQETDCVCSGLSGVLQHHRP